MWGTITERLAGNCYSVDPATSHIAIDQEIARATGTGRLLVQICPAHVYTEEADGTLTATYAACLECGTCLAVAAPGALTWRYPRGAYGIAYREG